MESNLCYRVRFHSKIETSIVIFPNLSKVKFSISQYLVESVTFPRYSGYGVFIPKCSHLSKHFFFVNAKQTLNKLTISQPENEVKSSNAPRIRLKF